MNALADEFFGWERLRDNSVARAFAISLLVHILLLSVFQVGRKTGVFKSKSVPSWMLHDLNELQKKAQQQRAREEAPLIFVEVDPAQASAQPPKNAKFYSSRNAVASSAKPSANPDAALPRLEGLQKHVYQTLERGLPKPAPAEAKLAPALAQTKPAPKAEPRPKANAADSRKPQPKTGPTLGNLAMAKPMLRLGPNREEIKAQPLEPAPQPQPRFHLRPRTLAEARLERGILGDPMQLDGGAPRLGIRPAFDTKATTFGAYDEAVIEAIRARWYSLLSERDVVRNASGKVVLEFRLMSDGRVTDLRIAENGVGNEMLALYCEAAIQDPAPYAKWPSDMRRLIGKDYRDVRFTFYYN